MSLLAQIAIFRNGHRSAGGGFRPHWHV